MPQRIRIVIADDHQGFRDNVAAILSREPDMLVVGQGASAPEALALAGQFHPDIILLDLDMPGDGLTVIEPICSLNPRVRIVVLTSSGNDDHLDTALNAGAKGYVLKGVSARQLVAIIRSIHDGGHYSPQNTSQRLPLFPAIS